MLLIITSPKVVEIESSIYIIYIVLYYIEIKEKRKRKKERECATFTIECVLSKVLETRSIQSLRLRMRQCQGCSEIK